MTIHNTKMNNDTDQIEIAIIGAGLTGLMSAHLLEQAFANRDESFHITIFEKSAGVGRLATRYKTPADNDGLESEGRATDNHHWQFDFGAQFFTAKSDDFQDYLKPFLETKVIEPWYANIATASDTKRDTKSDTKSDTSNDSSLKITDITQWDNEQPRYISSPKMTSFGRDIAKHLKHTTIHYKTKVAPLTKEALFIDKDSVIGEASDIDKTSNSPNSSNTSNNSKTKLRDNHGNTLGIYDWVVCTAPQPQALELIADTDFVHKEAIAKHKMLACYSLMLGWQNEDTLPDALKFAKWDTLMVESHDNKTPFAKIFLEYKKTSREAILPSVTLHSSNGWAQQHVDDDIDDVKATLLATAQSLLQWDKTHSPDHIDCHRWRYAATAQDTIQKNTQQAYFDIERKFIVTGDWCIEGRIESCFDAANRVVSIITDNLSAY